jgi:hypothetical protein
MCGADQAHGYIAAILTHESSEHLKALACFSETVCHHVTMAFNSPYSDWEPYLTLIGNKVILQVVGVATNGRIQAVLVQGVPSEKALPHITISKIESAESVESNEMLALALKRGVLRPIRMTLIARVAFIPIDIK